MTFAVRVARDPSGVAEAIRRAVAAVDSGVPLFGVRSQIEQIDVAVRQERVFAWLASGFGLLALLLACLGVYGTLAYGVERRTPEIGVRMALGATRGNVVAMILRESLVPVAVGVAAGVAGGVGHDPLPREPALRGPAARRRHDRGDDARARRRRADRRLGAVAPRLQRRSGHGAALRIAAAGRADALKLAGRPRSAIETRRDRPGT